MSTVQEKIQAAILAGRYLYPLQRAQLRDVELIKPAWLMEAEQWLQRELPALVQDAEARGEHELELGPNEARAIVCRTAGLEVVEHAGTANRRVFTEYVVRWAASAPTPAAVPATEIEPPMRAA